MLQEHTQKKRFSDDDEGRPLEKKETSQETLKN
jgi:hypothetical protein